MVQAELTAKSYPALLSAFQFHYDLAWPGMQRLILPQDDLLKRIQGEFPRVPVKNVYAFMQDCASCVVQPIEIRPEGFIFTAETPANFIFAKIYNGSAIDRNAANSFVDRIFSNVLIAEQQPGVQPQQTPREIVAEELNKKSPEYAYFYASAEAFTRAMASAAYPAMMHRPTALVDQKGEAVGFYIELDKNQQVVSTQHVAKADVAFYTDPDKPTELVGIMNFEQNNDLSPQVVEIISALKKINVLVYQEQPDDLLNQVLLDREGKLITFARLGYLIS